MFGFETPEAVTYYVWQLCYDYIHYNEGIPYDQIRQLPFDSIAEKSRGYFFNFDYTLFDETYKDHLEKAFIMNFFLYEIGFDTPHSFLQQLQASWIIKIPTYNKFYESLDMIENPMYTVDMETSVTAKNDTSSSGTNSGTTHNESSSNASGTYSDYPQTLLGKLDYGTSGTKDGSTSEADSTQSSTSESSSEASSTETSTTKGFNGAMQGTLLTQYRNTLLNVDMLLFNDLQDLFLGIY